ncbi:MAG: ABC transporter permease [Fusobacteriaceae bacterium]
MERKDSSEMILDSGVIQGDTREKIEEPVQIFKQNKVKEYLLKYSVYFVLIALIIFFSFYTPVFLGKANISNFARQIPTLGILTVAISILLITGGVDLSMGSIVAFSGTAAAYFASQGHSIPVVLAVGLICGAGFGILNGILITKFKLEAFIVTLGTSLMIRGLILFLTNGIYVKGLPDWFYALSNTKTGIKYIYTNTLCFIIIAVLGVLLMKKTRFGRTCYAVGSNREAARLSGINVNKHFLSVYALEGTLAAIAGILLMSTLNVGAPNEANGMDLFALAGAIIGGTQFGGGTGTIGGALVGLFTIEVFKNGLAILGINSFIQQAVTGFIIVVAIVVDYFRKNKI